MRTRAANLIDQAGICHHEIGNLIVFCVIVWSLAVYLVITYFTIGATPRIYPVDGVKAAFETAPYYGLPDTWINQFVGKGNQAPTPTKRTNAGE